MPGTDTGLTFLEETEFLDWRHPNVQAFAQRAAGGATDVKTLARNLFAAVRDEVWYDPYSVSPNRADYRASAVAVARGAFCVPKAVLLTAVCRAAGIPARLGFADVRNHLQTPALRERMGGQDLFVYHGYTELLVDGRWVKATPAFNRELCVRFGVEPLEFDGVHDALLHPSAGDGSKYMEYVRDHGWFADLPFERLFAALHEFYGPQISAQVQVRDAFTEGRDEPA